MNTVFGTHLFVLANTHPELKNALVTLIKADLSSHCLERYQDSPIYSAIIFDMAAIFSNYSSNFHRMNMVLSRLNKLVDQVSGVNYEHLSESQRADLPELAKEVDEANIHIRKEIYPVTIESKELAARKINDILGLGKQYIKDVYLQIESQIVIANNELGIDAKLEEGLTIISQHDLNSWIERNQQIDGSLIAKLLEDREDPMGFCKLILALEVLICISRQESDTKGSDLKSAMKHLMKVSLSNIDFIEVETDDGQFVTELKHYDERSRKLEEIFSDYPVGTEALDSGAVKDLDRLSKPIDLFTNVDGDE